MSLFLYIQNINCVIMWPRRMEPLSLTYLGPVTRELLFFMLARVLLSTREGKEEQV